MSRKIFLICLCVWALIGIAVWHRTEAQQIDTRAALSKVRNHTHGVEAKEILIDDRVGPLGVRMSKMRVKNNAENVNLEFVIIGNQEAYTTFHFYDEPINVGTERVITLGVRPEDFNNERVNILAAGYSDGTYEGKHNLIQRVIAEREAYSSEYKQILALIDQVLKMEGDDILGEFKARFEAMPPITTEAEPELRNHIRSMVAEKFDEYEVRRAGAPALTGRVWLEAMREWYSKQIWEGRKQ